MPASVKASLRHRLPFHVFIKVCCSLASNFIELLLLLNALLVDLLSADDILDIIISWGGRVTTQEVLHRLRVGNLGVVQKGANERSERNSLLLAPQDDILHTCQSHSGCDWSTLRTSSLPPEGTARRPSADARGDTVLDKVDLMEAADPALRRSITSKHVISSYSSLVE